MKRVSFLKNMFRIVIMMGLFVSTAKAQICSLSMSVTTAESRCKATGSIIVTVSSGSGNYNYTVTGGSLSTNTSSNIIGGLEAGTYSVKVKDITTGCTAEQTNIIVGGSYQDPRFTLTTTNTTCYNSATGSIAVSNLQYGRGPFTFTIIAPSAAAVGTSNATGIFNNLPSGNYSVQLSDSCGGLQTRITTISNYTWNFTVGAVTKPSCDSMQVTLTATDYLGNTNNGNPAFNGFMYGISFTAGDTIWSSAKTFTAFKGNKRNGTAIVKDMCGNYEYLAVTDNQVPNINGWVNTGNLTCSGFDASIGGQQNLTNPNYCLYTNSAALIGCNSTGSFSNVAYGSYYIEIKDVCYDTTFRRYFSVSQPIGTAGATVTVSNRTCSGFDVTAPSTTISNPQYCLKDSNNAVVACNTTGVFINIPYGPYCMVITDPCSGGFITRCFIERKGKPALSNIAITNKICGSFTASAIGASNTSNPQYCLYDSLNNLVGCNTTGIFNNLPYGSYCMHLKNDPLCYDTTIVSCFTVLKPVPSVDANASISNKACATFSAAITGQQNTSNPQFCLYDNSNNLINCNTTGQFDNIPYGSYCIQMKNDSACYDTTITRCFTVTAQLPYVSAMPKLYNLACTTFSASIGRRSNLTNPQYCLYDNSNNLVSCNTIGTFDNIPYGSYCIKVKNDPACYDTTISVCFTQAPIVMSVTGSSDPSCVTVGNTNLHIKVGNGTAPYTYTVYDPAGNWISAYTGNNGTSVDFWDLPALPANAKYKVVVQSACSKDSVYVQPAVYSLTKSINGNSKCPGGLWLNGAGDLIVSASFSGGAVLPSITQKNGSPFVMNYSSVNGSNYTFSDMEPAIYTIQYYMPTCNRSVYDTYTLKPYAYPDLTKSAVYQCNNNNFSVSAAVTGGVAPFTYEIIGSLPALPSIAAAPQNAPTFAISNGVNYSLVRLRATDACGNATINDASILPLANTLVTASSDCYYNAINLSVDTVANATYTWYKKTSAVDSVVVSNNQTHTIPYLLPTDTGTYVNVMSVNSGCLTKISSFRVTGMCGGLLAVNGLTFGGQLDKDNVQLKWTTRRSFDASRFVVERSADAVNFKEIGSAAVSSSNAIAESQYYFGDVNATAGKNFYRLRIIRSNGKIAYSDVVTISKKGTVSVSVMPNPVAESFTIKFQPVNGANYAVSLMSADGKVMMNSNYAVRPGDARTIQRPGMVATGVYYLVVTNQSTNEKDIIKLFFK